MGAIASIVISGLVVIYLEFTGTKPFGIMSGIWGLALSTLLFTIISLVTKAPTEKANEFINIMKNRKKTV